MRLDPLRNFEAPTGDYQMLSDPSGSRIGGEEMFWLLVTALWAAMLLSPFVLLYLFLPTGRECPRCAGETLPIRSRLLRVFGSLASLRWCMTCGWEGVSRNTVMRRPLPKFEVVPDDSGESDDDAPWRQKA
jgi:hypothetical protein